MRTRVTWTEFRWLQGTSLWINWRCPFQVLKTSLETLSFRQTAGSAGNNPGQKGPMEMKPEHGNVTRICIRVPQVRDLKPNFMCCTMQRALWSLAAKCPFFFVSTFSTAADAIQVHTFQQSAVYLLLSLCWKRDGLKSFQCTKSQKATWQKLTMYTFCMNWRSRLDTCAIFCEYVIYI